MAEISGKQDSIIEYLLVVYIETEGSTTVVEYIQFNSKLQTQSSEIVSISVNIVRWLIINFFLLK